MKATKKLILAAVSLVAASSLTVGSTFAWFSYKASVELESVGFSVDSSDENLQVAVVAHNDSDEPEPSAFSYTLSETDIKGKINEGLKYKPLTVDEVGEDNTVSATNAINLVDEDGTDATESDYAVFDLIFRYTPVKAGDATAEMPFLVLNNGSKITAGDVRATTSNPILAWKDLNDYGTAREEGDSIDARARDAARVAFLYDDNGTTKNKVWAPSEAVEEEIQALTSDKASGFYLGNLANDYKNKDLTEEEAEAAAARTPQYANRIYAGSSKNDFDYSKIAQFPPIETGKTYSELKLTVKVWLEGNDGDCIESFKGDSFAFLLKFTTVMPESGS